MKTTARFKITAAGVGATLLFTFVSACAAGIAADPTIVGFSLLFLWGLFEIILLDSQPPALARRRPARVPRWSVLDGAARSRTLSPFLAQGSGEEKRAA